MFRHAEEARQPWYQGHHHPLVAQPFTRHGSSQTTLLVIGGAVKSRALSGLDSLYSIVQMPGGVPVATMAIGEAGATNAAALRLLSVEDQAIATALAIC